MSFFNNCNREQNTNGCCCIDINRLIRVLSVKGPTGPTA